MGDLSTMYLFIHCSITYLYHCGFYILSNPMDGGVWWAAVHGVAKSWTRLKRLSSSSSNSILYFGLQSNITSLFCSNCSSFDHWEVSVSSRVPSISPPPFILTNPYILAMYNTAGSSFVFSTGVLGSAIFPRSPGSFQLRMALETKVQTLVWLIVTGESLLLGPLS